MQVSISEDYGVLSQFLPPIHSGAKPVDALVRDAEVPPFRALIVDASAPLARLIAVGLLTDCSLVELSHDLESALRHFDKAESDLLILDLDLPNMNAPELLRRLRIEQPGLRVLALSGRSGVEDLVKALDNGADDYLSKPFSLIELMARVRALCRRSRAVARTLAPKSTSLVLHRDQCRVERDGSLIDLTPREFTLLEFLMANPGKTLSRAVLTQKVWNMPGESNTNIVDVYIKYLRDKLDGDHDVKLIRTVRGLGYSYLAEA